MACMTDLKDSRIAVLVSAQQNDLIRHAAEMEGQTVTDFTVQAAVSHARDVLSDRRLFQLDDAAWNEFLAILDRPVQYPHLARLLAEESTSE
jgi:uncharacterized protein (DUF1778 family)